MKKKTEPQASRNEPKQASMDDIARRFLSLPPAPHKPTAKPAIKKATKPAK